MGPPVPINIAFPLRVERYTSATSSVSFPDINSGFYLDMFRRFTRSYQVGYANNAEGFAQYAWSSLQENPTMLLPPTFPGASADASAFVTDWSGLHLTPSHLLTLLYLGAIASALAFFLWNLGASRVGTGTLAVLNNAKVPLTVACSLLFFGEQADPLRLLASIVLLGFALWLAERRPARSAPP